MTRKQRRQEVLLAKDIKSNLGSFYPLCHSILQTERNSKQYPLTELYEAALIYAEVECDVQKSLELCEIKRLEFKEGENAIKSLYN